MAMRRSATGCGQVTDIKKHKHISRFPFRLVVNVDVGRGRRGGFQPFQLEKLGPGAAGGMELGEGQGRRVSKTSFVYVCCVCFI